MHSTTGLFALHSSRLDHLVWSKCRHCVFIHGFFLFFYLKVLTCYVWNASLQVSHTVEVGHCSHPPVKHCLFSLHSNRRTWRAMWALQTSPTKFTENLWREASSSRSWLWVSTSLLEPCFPPQSVCDTLSQSCMNTNTERATASPSLIRVWCLFFLKRPTHLQTVSMSMLEFVAPTVSVHVWSGVEFHRKQHGLESASSWPAEMD